MGYKPNPKTEATLKARQLYAAAWDDFRGTFYDDERVQAEANMKKVRQRLYDTHDCDVGQNFLGGLPGYMEYMHLYRSENKRFNWE